MKEILPMLSVDIFAEIRGWLILVLSVIGGFISLRTFIENQKQRRIENSLRLVVMFKESLLENDIQEWKKMFHSTSEIAGAKKGFYVILINRQRIQLPLSNLFAEGPPDHGAIKRMAELFDLISYQMLNNKLDNRLIYFQLGQLMNTVHSWLEKIESPYSDQAFIEVNYPSFNRLYQTSLIDKDWVCRTYAVIG
ncbi:hypothetical protein [Synechococcus elongatus]|uniref:hypothetical protein n=1 Tax=Synechococcus elongatus TaxID=32046 RepID=UPI0030CB33DD